MYRVIAATVLLVLPVGLGAAQQVAEEASTTEALSRQAATLQDDIRRSHNPEARRRLVERLELVYHKLGPTDAAGQRIRCQAMWHDRTLERLGQEMKRLSGREVPLADAHGAALVRHGRIAVRRMARACLTHGWRIYSGETKYQVDAFGQYLANNLATLDGLLKRLSGLSAPPAGAAADGPKAAALEKARTGLAMMEEAADALSGTPSNRPAVLVSQLGTFMEGLTAVRDAVEGVAAAPESPDEPPAETEAGESPPMTEDETARLAALRETAAALRAGGGGTGESAWSAVAGHLERFAAMIEAGFTVASARPKARELLEQSERAARLAQGFASDTVLTDALLAERRRQLLAALESMGRPAERAEGYARLQSMEGNDAFRRKVQAAGLSPETGRGLVRAFYEVAPAWKDSTSAEVIRNGTAMTRACFSLVRTLERMQGWPPDGMAAGLKTCYDRQKALFLREVELAGARADKEPQEALPLLEAAAQRSGDLALIVRAETVVQAIKRYRPRQAGPMYQRLVQAAQALVVDPDNAARPRARLAGLVRPFEDLESFPAPDPALRRTLGRLLGQAYTTAVAKLSRDLGEGINRAAAGDPTLLRTALRADDLFGLARKRALAEQARLQQVGVANLAAFSMSPEAWASFHAGLDRRLQGLFTAYLREARTSVWYTQPRDLEAVYGPVAAAQRQTMDARFPGEADLDFLMRNLAAVAVPNPPEPTREGWAVGYHVTEAVVTTLADMETVADWHRRRLRPYRTYLNRVDLAPPSEPPS
jgi:hypothetical protein